MEEVKSTERLYTHAEVIEAAIAGINSYETQMLRIADLKITELAEKVKALKEERSLYWSREVHTGWTRLREILGQHKYMHPDRKRGMWECECGDDIGPFTRETTYSQGPGPTLHEKHLDHIADKLTTA